MICDLEKLSQKIPILSWQDQPQDNWASDAGRNSNSAKWGGTFIGYVTQLTIEFGELTQSQITELKRYVQRSIFRVRYQSSDNGEWITEKFYGTTIPAKKDYIYGKYKPFSLTLTGVDLRDEVL